MKQKTKKLIKRIRKHAILRIPIGTFFIILGITGIILPIIPGWIFLLIGLLILFGPEVINLKKIKRKIKDEHSIL